MTEDSFDAPILHRVNLDAVGGVEVTFLQYALFRHAREMADTVVVGESVHPRFEAALAAPFHVVWRSSFKYWRGVRLPRSFRRLRARQAASVASLGQPEVILAWNHIGSRETADIACRARLPLIHYEHGEAWRPKARHAQLFFNQVDGAIVNSYAAQRMLELRWGWQGNTRQVYYSCNGVLPMQAARKKRPEPGRVRMGAAARMIELKGHRIALHTLKYLRQVRGVDATLAMAGTGEEEASLQAECRHLGLCEHVDFLGSVADMARFYDDIDVMLVPSMVEPFGRTSMEAQARGCPLLVTAVDGLPETLEDDNTLALIAPDLSLQEYKSEIGGHIETVLPWAYDPRSDDLVRPRAVSPERLANAVCALIDSDAVYSEASLSGLRNANARFLPDAYGPALDEAVTTLLPGRV